MKMLVILGSPRKGNTYKVLQLLEKAMKTEFDYLFLKDMDMPNCIGCNNCLTVGEDKCPHKDKTATIRKKLHDADAVIFASPVYVMNVTALYKNMVDHLAFACHRPEFFKHAMFVCTTGAIGLKETLNYMRSVAEVWGFSAKVKLGLATGLNAEKMDIKKIDKAARDFKKELRKPVKPTLNQVIQFRMQKAIFASEKNKGLFKADYAYWKGKTFFYKTKVPLWKMSIAYMLEKIFIRSFK